MKKEPVTEKEQSTKTQSSIALSSETVCEDEACIGKIANDPSSEAQGQDEEAEKQTKQARTSMSIGGKDACTDEACIGKT